MTTEEKAKAYDEAIEKIKYVMDRGVEPILNKADLQSIFPELRESEDERIRKELIEFIKIKLKLAEESEYKTEDWKRWIAWLEKQKGIEWKPSKDEMDVLYALCYITNTIDDRKDAILTKLYQDLKREFFNGASYENMFPKEEKQKEQKPAKWSEEDRLRLIRICADVEDFFPYNKETNKEIARWIKSLRPQNHWKPSKKQLHSLRQVISGCSYDIKPLLEIEEQLRKL